MQPPVPGDGEYGMARWSPDGGRIVFGGKYNPPECDALAEQGQTGGGGLNHLYLMNADGSDFSPLTEGCRQGNSGARWSPDGSMIAFSSRRHAPSGQDIRPYGVIYLIDPVTGEETRLSAADRLQSPVWSPGGDQLLAYWDWLKGVATVSVADGSHDILFTVDDPAWVLPEVWSPDSQRALVFMGDSPEQGDLHLLDLTTGELTEIANTSKSWGGTDWRR
ncbi:MAG: hypothetical protein R3253_05800 [Longimicrobiales bacterium]|nr:hypothetical protein [Longimicrobiales bacterium]